jgi:hypothetical protein
MSPCHELGLVILIPCYRRSASPVAPPLWLLPSAKSLAGSGDSTARAIYPCQQGLACLSQPPPMTGGEPPAYHSPARPAQEDIDFSLTSSTLPPLHDPLSLPSIADPI